MANDVRTIAETRPRSVKDAGATILVGSGSLSKAREDPDFQQTFRVRAPLVRRVLYLLMRHHKYMKLLYPHGPSEEALSALPEDGVPIDLPVMLHEDAAAVSSPRLGELAVTSNAVRAWLNAGDDEPSYAPPRKVAGSGARGGRFCRALVDQRR